MATDVNQFRGARQFAHKWDYFARREAPSALGAIRVASKRSPFGNINIDGVGFSSPSVMYVPSQEGFWLAIEPGVRSLVRCFIHELDVITYTSCEGHLYEAGRQPDVRTVGVLPRNIAEYRQVRRICRRASAEFNAESMLMVASVLRRKLADGQALLSVVDVALLPRKGTSWAAYFESLQRCTDSLIQKLIFHRRAMFQRSARPHGDEG
jgi:hypothetical protein